MDIFGEQIRDFLTRDHMVIPREVLELLLACVSDYDPKAMVMAERTSTIDLKIGLKRTNKVMRKNIVRFVSKCGNQSKSNMKKIDVFLAQLMSWKIDSLSTVHKYTKFAVEYLTRVAPALLIAPDSDNQLAKKYWNFAPEHVKKLESSMNYHRIALKQCERKEPIIQKILTEYRQQIDPLAWFMDCIPLLTPLQKGKDTYHAFLPKDAYLELFNHLILSAINQYIVISEGSQQHAAATPLINRPVVEERTSLLPPLQELAMDDIFNNDVENVEIILGQAEKGMNAIGSILVVMLAEIKDSKSTMNLPYADINIGMHMTKTAEKDKITTGFFEMSTDMRKTEDLMKNLRLGKWNEGQKKTLVQYDKKAYDAVASENEEYHRIIMFANQSGDARDVDAMMNDENRMADHDVANEMDIQGLSENYMDGEYYNDNADENE
jgi:hypothetical protein